MASRKATETIRADDFVEYFLFPDLSANSSNESINEEEFLRELLEKINNDIRPYVEQYIWHKDPFCLIPRCGNSSLLNEEPTASEDDLPAHLHGLTFYGENIEDEWLIVDLLFKLTKLHKGLIARVVDTDGEFVLIEAANHLPTWANPDSCEQRVYIYDGELHLVQNSPSNTANLLPVSSAIERIRSQARLYKVPPTISNCIQTRISSVTQEVHNHKATVYLPASAALILREKPALIAAAVRAFCNRDSIDMKACRAMKHFPPETRIYTEATFTRCLYAMLTHTTYNPDRRTGWSLPAPGHDTFKAHELGMKIASGLEILASKANAENDLEQDKEWHSFLNRLKENGYFGDNIEHSKGYVAKLQSAIEYYKIFADSRPTYVTNAAKDIISSLNNIDISLDNLHIDEMQTYSPNDDNEDWLNISSDDLDRMLAERYGITKSFNANVEDNQSADSAAALAHNLKSFLAQKSEFDGVDVRPIPPKRGVKKNQTLPKMPEQAKVRFTEQGPETNDNNNIDFNPDAFQHHLKDMLDMVIPEDNWDSHSDMSDFDDDLIDKNIEEMSRMPNGTIDETLKSYMEQMDRELAGTTIGKSFRGAAEKKDIADDGQSNDEADDDFDDIESFKPVNIDVNALQNLAESYQAQFGGHGPAASLLGSLGMRIDPAPSSAGDKTENMNGIM